jgi:hypothetical protein
MGWKDKLRAAADEARDRAAEAAGKAKGAVEERHGDDPRYQRLKGSAGRGVSRSKELKDRGVERFGASAAGQYVGSSMRAVGREARKLPLLGVASDAIAHRHGVADLVELRRQDPTDPERTLWLAEALLRAEKTTKTYRRMRAVTDPTSIVTRAAMSTAAELGAEKKAPVTERLLRHAYGLALVRLREDPRDGRAWHVCARVHLARGDAEGARVLAQLAVLAAPEDVGGIALVTVARAQHALGRRVDAADSARRAIERGCSLGNEVFAALVRGNTALSASERIDKAAALRSRIRAEDRAAYQGVAPTVASTATGVATAQARKTRDAVYRPLGKD